MVHFELYNDKHHDVCVKCADEEALLLAVRRAQETILKDREVHDGGFLIVIKHGLHDYLHVSGINSGAVFVGCEKTQSLPFADADLRREILNLAAIHANFQKQQEVVAVAEDGGYW